MPRNYYRNDPRWITARYAGTDAKGTPFEKGERVFYYPNTKTIYAGAAAVDAALDFASSAFDEDCFGGFAS